jgi:hypothetical protein
MASLQGIELDKNGNVLMVRAPSRGPNGPQPQVTRCRTPYAMTETSEIVDDLLTLETG